LQEEKLVVLDRSPRGVATEEPGIKGPWGKQKGLKTTEKGETNMGVFTFWGKTERGGIVMGSRTKSEQE